MSISELHNRLTEFGFTLEEAQIFIFLTLMGPTPVRVIAKRFDINRVKAYRLLNELEEKGLVQKTMERPVRFMAQSIEDILHRQIQTTKETLHSLESNQEKIIEDIERIRAVESKTEEDPLFRIYQGRQQIYELITNMSDRVEEEIRIITPSTDFLRLTLWGLDSRLAELVRAGKKVKLLTEIDESLMNEIEALNDKFEIRHISVPSSVRFITVDKDETLTSVAIDDTMSMTTQNDTGLWTNASGFTEAIQIFYDSLWENAPDSQVILNSLKTGKRPQEFVTIRTLDEHNRHFISLVQSAEKSIDVMVNKIQDLPFNLQKFTGTSENCKTRILTHVDESTTTGLVNINPVIEIRHNPNQSRLSLVVIDGRESLLTTLGTETSIHGVWSNLRDYVETTLLIFEDYWNNSSPVEVRYREITVEQNRKEISEVIVSCLLSDGWTVSQTRKVPGRIQDDYALDIFAEKQGRAIGVNIIIDENGFNQIFELSSRKEDLRGVELFICSVRRLEDEVVWMSSLYGIRMIHGIDVKDMVETILFN